MKVRLKPCFTLIKITRIDNNPLSVTEANKWGEN